MSHSHTTLLRRIILIFTVGTLTVGVAATLFFFQLTRSYKLNLIEQRMANTVAWVINTLDSAKSFWQVERAARILRRPGISIRMVDNQPLPQQFVRLFEKPASRLSQLIQTHTENQYDIRVNLLKKTRDLHKKVSKSGYPGARSAQFNRQVLQVIVRMQDTSWLKIEMPYPQARLMFPWQTILVLLAILITVMALSIVAVRYSTRPLQLMARAAENFADNIHAAPIEEYGFVEVAETARAFNRMQARIRSLIQEKSDFLAAISHDLKTPLTRMKLRNEFLSDEKLKQQFNHDIDEMRDLIEAALQYCRDGNFDEATQLFDLGALCEALRDDYNDNTTRITLNKPETVVIQAKPMLLKRCIQNIVDNALHYAGNAEITLKTDDMSCQIDIQDSGPGIAESDLSKVFEPFYRSDKSRNLNNAKHGLGLSIARNIVQIHKGRIELKNQSPGLLVRITLPTDLALLE